MGTRKRKYAILIVNLDSLVRATTRGPQSPHAQLAIQCLCDYASMCFLDLYRMEKGVQTNFFHQYMPSKFLLSRRDW